MLSIILLFLTYTAAGYLIPNPPGKYNVTLTIGTLIDYTRNVTSATTPTPRELMLSVFQPATCATTVPVFYMPNKTAEYQGPFLQKQFNLSVNFTPLFLEARLPVCLDNCISYSSVEDHPILLLSPGYGIPRLYYNVIASAIASEGFIVITIDHPEDANIITYPDGRAIYNNGPSNPTAEEYISYVNSRVMDASFIIDQLNNATAIAKLLPQRGARRFRTDHIVMLGHSLGGVAAVIASGQDPRVRGAINCDGSIFNPLPSSGLFSPVLYVSEANGSDPTWLAAWPQLEGPKLWLEVANTTHMAFCDAPALLHAATQETETLGELLGVIQPDRLLRVLAAYTTAWMNGTFKGKVGGPLLQGQEPDRFPEASIVRKSNY